MESDVDAPPPDLMWLLVPLQLRATPPWLAAVAAPAQHHVHGWFFDLVRWAAPEVARALHPPIARYMRIQPRRPLFAAVPPLVQRAQERITWDSDMLDALRAKRRQPFTALLLDEGAAAPPTEVRSAQTVWLRLSFLWEPMLRLWQELLKFALLGVLHLGPDDPDHPPELPCASDYEAVRTVEWQWQSTRYPDLWPVSDADIADAWRIRFLTPCTFHPGSPKVERDSAPTNRTLPLPDPVLVLKNLADGLRTWADDDVGGRVPDPHTHSEMFEHLARHLQIEDHQLQGVRVEARPGHVRWAFTGELTLADTPGRRESAEATKERRRLLTALLALAPYSGIGVQLARGMGAVAVTPLSR
jgi:hypothetical protein